MGWDPRTIYQDLTYDAYRERVREDVDAAHGGPASSLDEARAERASDHSPVPWWSAAHDDAATPNTSLGIVGSSASRVGPSHDVTVWSASAGHPRPLHDGTPKDT